MTPVRAGVGDDELLNEPRVAGANVPATRGEFRANASARASAPTTGTGTGTFGRPSSVHDLTATLDAYHLGDPQSELNTARLSGLSKTRD